MIYKTGISIGLMLFGLSNASANLIANGDFQAGNLSSWTNFTTANGTISGMFGAPDVVSFSTNGAGASLAAQFGVGELTFDRTQQGGGIYQSFLTGSGAISISADIAAFNNGAFNNLSAGVFNLLLDSVVVDTVNLGHIPRNQIERGVLTFSGAVGAGSHELRILITRPFLAPEQELSQYVDNVNVNAAVVPEPATFTLLGLGLAGLGFIRSRKA